MWWKLVQALAGLCNKGQNLAPSCYSWYHNRKSRLSASSPPPYPIT